MTRTPVPSKAEGFKLTDDCTLSGIRLRADDRRVDGGGYFRPDCPDRLVPAHGFVEVPVVEVVGRRLKRGERVVKNPTDLGPPFTRR